MIFNQRWGHISVVCLSHTQTYSAFTERIFFCKDRPPLSLIEAVPFFIRRRLSVKGDIFYLWAWGNRTWKQRMLRRWSLVFDLVSLITFFCQILMSLRSQQSHPFEVGFTTWLNWLGQPVGLPFSWQRKFNWKTGTWLCEVLIKWEDQNHVACLCFASQHLIIIRGSDDKGNYITSTSTGQQFYQGRRRIIRPSCLFTWLH